MERIIRALANHSARGDRNLFSTKSAKSDHQKSEHQVSQHNGETLINLTMGSNGSFNSKRRRNAKPSKSFDIPRRKSDLEETHSTYSTQKNGKHYRPILKHPSQATDLTKSKRSIILTDPGDLLNIEKGSFTLDKSDRRYKPACDPKKIVQLVPARPKSKKGPVKAKQIATVKALDPEKGMTYINFYEAIPKKRRCTSLKAGQLHTKNV